MRENPEGPAAVRALTAALAAAVFLGGGRTVLAAGGEPLSQIVSAQVSDCGGLSTVQVPLITWGGDIPTIYANGNAAATAGGGIFAQEGLTLRLAREDVFKKQVEAYLACRSPYLRGTAGMLAMASEVTERDERTKMVAIYQLTWSAGGDALVVKAGIDSPAALKGKTIALQSYGPHVDYLGKVLSDAGLSLKDIRIQWVNDLTGTDRSPGRAFAQGGVDAAMVIVPDALALTSGGKVGTGAEDSVKGARMLLTTKSANRIIADLYAVRSDYFNSHRKEVESFVRGLLKAQEEVKKLVKENSSRRSEYNKLLASSGQILMDSPEAAKDVEGMYADAEFAGYAGNVQFFSTPQYPRSFNRLMSEIQSAFIPLGLVASRRSFTVAGWDFSKLKSGLSDTSSAVRQRFDKEQVALVVSKRQKQGTLAKSGLFTFEVFFKPNQSDFPESLYEDSFKKAIDLAATYGGAILTVEGHSDPLGYLRKVKAREPQTVLKSVRQAAKNLSLARGNAVRDSLVRYAKGKGISLDASQFAVVGHGIDRPSTGMCGEDPCAPKSEQEWLNNMRVEFRIVSVEAEESVFKPL